MELLPYLFSHVAVWLVFLLWLRLLVYLSRRLESSPASLDALPQLPGLLAPARCGLVSGVPMVGLRRRPMQLWASVRLRVVQVEVFLAPAFLYRSDAAPLHVAPRLVSLHRMWLLVILSWRMDPPLTLFRTLP